MKRKLLCIAVAIIMILPLAFAAIPMASAAVADGWIYNDDASRYRINTDGSLSISYNAAGVSWANLGAGYDASAFNNNYTLTVDVFIPAYSTGEVAGAPAVTTPTPVISVKAAQVSPLDPNYNWVGNGIIVKFADYQGRVSEDMYTAWGNTWKVAELFAQDAALADCVNPNFSTLGFEAGEWATYKAVVDGNKVTIYINDVLFCNSYVDETAAGNYIWLGTNGDDWNWDNAPSFRNFKIVSNDGSVADYEAYTYVEPVDPNSVNWTDKVAAAGMTAGTVSYDANGSLILANPAGWWAQSGTGYNYKVKIDGLKIAFNLAAFEYAGVFGVNSYFAVTVHQSPIGDFGIGALVGARAYSLCPVDSNGFQASFGGSGLGFFVDALGGSADFQSAYNVVAGEDSTLEFKVEEGFIKFYINGTKVTFFDEELGEVVDYAVDATNILDEDGKAYLALSLVCEGSIGSSQGVTVKSINDVAPANFKESAPFNAADAEYTDKTAAAGMTAGTVSYDANGNLILANPAGWWAQSGTSFDHKVKVDGLKIAFNLAAFEYAGVFGVNSYFAVTVHQSPIGDFGIGALVGARAYSLCPVDSNGFQASFGGSGLGFFVDALGGSADFQSAYNVVAGEDSTLEFKVEEGFIKFYINGTKVTFFDEELGEVVDYAVDATNILDEDGKAYLAFSLVCEGSIGNSQGVTIKSVNGVTTGYYKAETTYADHKATTPVVQWRAPSESVAAGLRFKTTVALNGVNNNDSIVKMGTIIMPADKVTGGYLGHTADGKIDGTSYLDIVARNYYEKTNDSISFTAVLIGIPEDQLDRIFLAVSYIEYADGTITYGGLRAVSINDAMNA